MSFNSSDLIYVWTIKTNQTLTKNSQARTPNRISIIRIRIQDRWPDPDPIVGQLRVRYSNRHTHAYYVIYTRAVNLKQIRQHQNTMTDSTTPFSATRVALTNLAGGTMGGIAITFAGHPFVSRLLRNIFTVFVLCVGVLCPLFPLLHFSLLLVRLLVLLCMSVYIYE
jgi:hypothetical protein